MFCPKCNQYGSDVIDSRMTIQSINIRERKHRCKNCGYIYYTHEVIVKRNSKEDAANWREQRKKLLKTDQNE